jgi:peptidoglycan/xylan/chitin deacetylase (PgdA/CDA1 family)
MTVTTQTAPGQVPVLMYHALSAARTSGFHRWTLSADRLRSHLDFLSREGYRSVTVGGLLDCYRRGGPAPDEKLVALTFDDAYADFHDVALPLLLSYGLTGTLFVPTGYVGGHSGWMHGEGEGERTILSWAGLAEIAGCGIEIGAHSHTHPQMDRLPAAEMARQAAQPKAELEDRLGMPVATFAYPYGRYDRRVRDAVAAAGYRGACTMNSWAATAGSHALELPRTAVLHYMDAEMLAAELAASRSRVRRAVLRACRAAAAPVRRLRS